MRKEQELVESLRGATSLVHAAVVGQISIEEIVRRYDNFYYYEALDGHEADSETRELLERYRALISLHEDVQREVLDVVYFGPASTAESFAAAGRISAATAAQRLAALAEKHDVPGLLEKLGAVDRRAD